MSLISAVFCRFIWCCWLQPAPVFKTSFFIISVIVRKVLFVEVRRPYLLFFFGLIWQYSNTAEKKYYIWCVVMRWPFTVNSVDNGLSFYLGIFRRLNLIFANPLIIVEKSIWILVFLFRRTSASCIIVMPAVIPVTGLIQCTIVTPVPSIHRKKKDNTYEWFADSIVLTDSFLLWHFQSRNTWDFFVNNRSTRFKAKEKRLKPSTSETMFLKQLLSRR